MPTRKANATWDGGLKRGRGHVETETGSLATAYSFGTRFGSEKGSNPEELLAAAEAACYSMALGGALEKEGHAPTRIQTDAACTVEAEGQGFRITTMALKVRAVVPGCDQASFERIALTTKEACPVSRALIGNLEITVEAKLEEEAGLHA